MPFVEVPDSPHAPGIHPVRIHYRDVGSGSPLVFLHGGWGYESYPIRHQIEAFADRVRFVIPSRSGHGLSQRISGPMPSDFHQRAAEETLLVLNALSIERAIFWGHSDGAVIAARIGLTAPDRCVRLVLEAIHLQRSKPNSRDFFQKFAQHPGEVKESMQKLLAADHGENHWKNVVQRNCRAWLQLAADSARAGDDLVGDDLYDGRLSQLKVPVTLIHGRLDPRTEPGELEQARKILPHADIHFIEPGRHSPHSESKSWPQCNKILHGLLPQK